MTVPHLVLAPRAGARLRITNVGTADAGVAYVFDWITRPITAAENADIYGSWHRYGLEIRHLGAIDLLVTPIVDNVELTAQQKALTAADPMTSTWQRITLHERMFKFGLKAQIHVVSNTLPSAFHIDGAWFDVAPQPGYRPG